MVLLCDQMANYHITYFCGFLSVSTHVVEGKTAQRVHVHVFCHRRATQSSLKETGKQKEFPELIIYSIYTLTQYLCRLI